MTTQKKKSSKVQHLTLHNLIGAISFWGSATRVSIIGCIALAVFAIQVLDSQTAPATMSLLSSILLETEVLLYVVVSFFVLDIGYVIVAREHKLSLVKDKVGLIGSELVLATAYFLPYFAIVSTRFTYLTRFVFIAVLLILSLRIVIGVLYGRVTQK